MNLNKRFSMAHYDSWPDSSLYYEAVKNSSQKQKDEIYDIYFGKIFRYSYKEQEIWDSYTKNHEVSYGNVMGVEASDEQVDNLFKIQDEFGIEISMTINQLNIPVEMFYSKNNRVLDAFLDWLQGFYDRGLRSCTLANNHMMRAGFFQERFPEMKWKNTVNQQVSTAQQVLDYLYLGYNIIQLDRSLNRNMDELKRIKGVVDNYRSKFPEKEVKTCILIREDCLPSCPFKREHDDVQIYHRQIDYWERLGKVSCHRWRDVTGQSTLPRSGTNCLWASVDTFKEYAESVDIFKYSGRLNASPPVHPGDYDEIQEGKRYRRQNTIKSFSEIIENKLEPVYLWDEATGLFPRREVDIESVKEQLEGNIWMTDEGKKLEQRLKNCKNRCYECHLCERTFGVPDIGSIMEV